MKDNLRRSVSSPNLGGRAAKAANGALNKPYIPKRTPHITPVEELKSDMLEQGVRNVLELFRDERILAAGAYLDHVEMLLAKHGSSSGGKKAKVLLEDPEVQAKLSVLRNREEETLSALREFNSTEAGWTFAIEMAGVKTYFKEGENDTLWLKLEGVVKDVDLIDCCSVVRETDLFRNWVPFCNKSAMIKEVGPAELITGLNLNVPLAFQRDAVLHAFTCDASYEHNCIMVLGKSVEEFEGVNIPTSNNRMVFNGFRALVEPLSRKDMRMCVVTNIDLKLKLPKSLLNFVIKNLAGILISLMIQETVKIKKNPKSPYLLARQEDKSGFYRWAAPVFDEFFSTLDAGKLPKRFIIPDEDPAKASERAKSAGKEAVAPVQKPIDRSISYTGSLLWGFLAVLLYLGLIWSEEPNNVSKLGFIAAVWLSGFAFSQSNVKHFVHLEKLKQ